MESHRRNELHQFIDKFKNTPLSDGDIESMMQGKVNIVYYPDVHKYKSVDELLHPYGCCIILYVSKPHTGHWVCLTVRPEIHMKKNGNPKIILEYFNPYGSDNTFGYSGMPDDELHFIDDQFRIENNEDYPYLTRLILNCDYKLTYNEFPFQKLNSDIKTCGRWTVLRCLLRELSLEQFRDLFLGLYGDDLVTILTT